MTNQTKVVKHFIVQVEAYQAVVSVLQQLPYSQVASVIQKLQDGSKAIFERSKTAKPLAPVDPGFAKDSHPKVETSDSESIGEFIVKKETEANLRKVETSEQEGVE